VTTFLFGANRIEPRFGSIARVHGPELLDTRDKLFATSPLMGAPLVTTTSSMSFLEHVTYRVQKYASCVGWDLSQKIELWSLLTWASQVRDETGKILVESPIGFPSPLYNYTRARLLGEKDLPRKDGDPLLTDWGSGCRFAMKAVSETGLVLEGAWPESPETINRVPPADLFEDGAVATVDAYYRIPDGRVCKELGLPPPSVQIRDAMRRGYPPGCCMIVDQRYTEIGKATYDAPGGEIGGGHCQTIVVSDDERKALGLLSTWGRDVGDAGIFWVSDDYADKYFNDMWVVKSAPGLVV
jgi:hypothetical protein